MLELPTGTVTLLFSDVDSSTALVRRLGERYGDVLAEHRELLRQAFEKHGGIEIDTQGDAFFVVFGSARDAVASAIAAQRSLSTHSWHDGTEVRVRIGLHTCEPHRSAESYVGLGVHRAARICTIAHGGQVLLSRSTAGIVADDDAPYLIRDLGEHHLKDIERPERLFELVVEGLRGDFPPLRMLDQQPPLSGTATVLMTDGRDVMSLSRELQPEVFGSFLNDYQRLVQGVLEEMGGQEVEVGADQVVGAFPTAKQAVLAAVAAQRAVADHGWPEGLKPPTVAAGLHSGEAGVGWIGPAARRCAQLCDAAEGGQIFLSQAVSGLLEDEDLGELLLRDLGERLTRRGGDPIHAFELVYPPAEV